IAVGLAALASACAGHLDTPAPAYVSPSTFENLTCRQIGEAQKRFTRAEATRGRLDGNARDADDVALLKGRMDAVGRGPREKNCNVEFQHGGRGRAHARLPALRFRSYSAWMPASLTIFPHLPSWTLTKSSSSLGELENASKPTLPRLDFPSPLSMILR